MDGLTLCTLIWTTIITISVISISEGYVRSWNQECNYTAECDDHRLICSAVEKTTEQVKNVDLKKCVCDRFHEWKGDSVGCFPKFNISTIMSMVASLSNTEEELAKSTEVVFRMQAIAGIFVFVVVLLSAVVVLAYCCHIRRKDKLLKLEIQELKKAKSQPSSTTTV